MIQGGGFHQRFRAEKTHAPIQTKRRMEFAMSRRTIAMARTNIRIRHAQFYQRRGQSPLNFSPVIGYAVFGKVVKGMDSSSKK
jgi:cyclophilin family peptidyl-prolyl cis-trans isomerase